MTARKDRIVRVAKVAAENEEQARARWSEATQQVNAIDRQRETALDRAGKLAAEEIPVALRSHLTGAGARHLMSLADEKAELSVRAEALQVDLQEAATKLKSLERMIERLDQTEAEHRDRREAADLQDLVAVRAARGIR